MAEKAAKMPWTYWLHLAIGFFFMLIFPQLSPIEPLTEVGMVVLGCFIGMVYLWSAIDSIWPSLLGLLLIALGGYVPELQGYAAVKDVFLNSYGAETVISVMLSMILFSGVAYVGCTKYLARFFLSLKIVEGKPYVFMFILFLCSYVIAGFTNPMAAMLILWPIAEEICRDFGYKKGDKIFVTLICGIYLASTLGQPMLSFRGAQYMIVSAFQRVTELSVNYASYIAYNIIMSLILLVCYLLVIKFIIRPNVDGFKNLTIEELTKEKLPKMNFQQIAFFVMILIFVFGLISPNLLPKTVPGMQLLTNFGVLGVTVICIVAMMIIPFQGKPLLDFRAVARKSFSWDIFFLVGAAVYACNAMTAESTGIKLFLVQLLQPLLGNKPEILFIFLILAFAIITTNFANNGGMAVVLLPIVVSFADQYPGVDITVLYMTIAMMVFVALLTPAASPYCAILHGRKDLVSYGQILQQFVPMFLIALVVYALVGYQIAKFLF